MGQAKPWPGRATRIAVISDTHANIHALKTALTDIRKEGMDGIVHLGDAIGFGPHPAECLDLILSTPGISCVMGNHDSWCLKGDPGPGKPPGILAHLEWTWKRVSPAHRMKMADWPFRIERDYDGFRVAFQHYALDSSGRDFQEIERPPAPALYDSMFPASGVSVVFFGHDHEASDTAGRSRYLDPGSLGAGPEPVARWLLARFGKNGMEMEKRGVPYDRNLLWRDFEEREVPGRTEIISRFYQSQQA